MSQQKTGEDVILLPPWLEIYKKIKDRDYGDIITYKEIQQMIREKDRGKIQKYMRKQVERIMLEQHNKGFETVQGVGYRIVEPREHTRLAHREIHRARRRVQKACMYMNHVAFDRLSPSEQAQATLIMGRVQTLAAIMAGELKTNKEITEQYHVPQITH